MAARAFLGAGDIYLARQVAGVWQEFEGPFEASKFEIKPNVDLREQTSRGKLTYGQVLETVALQQPADLSIDLTEVNKTTLALALLGTTEGITQAAATVANEAIVAKLDKWVPATKFGWGPTVVVTNVAGSTTYVEGIDYLVNRQLGWIKAITGGAITEGATVHVDYAALAQTGTLIRGARDPQLRVRVKFDGVNFADNLPYIVTVHEAVIAADSAFDFLADNFATVTLPGRMKTPAGFTEPFTIMALNPTA